MSIGLPKRWDIARVDAQTLLFDDPLYLVNYLYAAVVAVARTIELTPTPTSLQSTRTCSVADSMRNRNRFLREWVSGSMIRLWSKRSSPSTDEDR